MKLRVLSNPVAEPITLEEARLHLRVDTEGSPAESVDDPLITGWISAAREHCEKYTGLILAERLYEGRENLIGSLYIPTSPVIDIQEITYLDDDGVLQTVDPSVYELDASDPQLPVVKLQRNQQWPSSNEGRIVFGAGYIAPGSSPAYLAMPFAIKAAILLMLGHLYENREATTAENLIELPLGVKALLRPHGINLGMA